MKIRLSYIALVLLAAGCMPRKFNSESSKTASEPEKCSPSGISACAMSLGGMPCFTQCDTQPSPQTCNMKSLGDCNNAKGGETECLKKYCNAGIGRTWGSGPYKAADMSQRLMRFPDSGEAWGSYDLEFNLRFAKPRVVERLQELSARVKKKTGYKIYVGDISNNQGGNSGRHSTHLDGLDVDIGIMGNTDKENCYNYTDACYDRKASLEFIGIVIEMGGLDSICFNDPAAIKAYPNVVRWCTGHDNHYHIAYQ